MQITSHLQTVPAGMSPINDNILVRKWRNWNHRAKPWETVRLFLSWWAELPCNPAPLFSGTRQEDLKAFIHIKTCSQVSTEVLFIISKAGVEKMCSPIERKKGRGCRSVVGCLPNGSHCVWSLTPPKIPIYIKIWLDLDKHWLKEAYHKDHRAQDSINITCAEEECLEWQQID